MSLQEKIGIETEGVLVDTSTGEIITPSESTIPAAPATQSPAAMIVATPIDLPIAIFRDALDRRKANRDLLMQWIRESLVDRVDYGRIHTAGKNSCKFAQQGMAADCPNPAHWSKPSLWKPGAEKICGMLGVSVHFPTFRDYEKAALEGVAIKNIILRCELKDVTGRTLSDGVGARSVEKDYGDLNKALKMASKSAMIDATLRMAGLSEVFTQDLEDTPVQPATAPPPPPKPAPAAKPAPAESAQVTVNPDTITIIKDKITELGLDEKRVKAWMLKHPKLRVNQFFGLTQAQADWLLSFLPKLAEQAKGNAA